MTTKKQRMYERITKHGQDLLKIFPTAKQQDPIALCKTLLRIETKTHRAAEDYCNGVIDIEAWEDIEHKTLDKLQSLLGKSFSEAVIHINADARGYALKIDDDWLRESGHALYRDWGGYGILAPTFDGEA